MNYEIILYNSALTHQQPPKLELWVGAVRNISVQETQTWQLLRWDDWDS
jgi:hypothetical protein